ncbi:hypothetical protein K504DRAFT_464585 [Pleomassaria siparia CBS 279.74]|uniref:Secreted protein n=1 Tax=Pleomassaria siparia CBS 279.74 TaxID=1314801 RepID=A0A6G1KIX4_9PLEO|nr:hypothetical protein K504DRAFT_464585 [Pleomassaria siparia CBS 279.74]
MTSKWTLLAVGCWLLAGLVKPISRRSGHIASTCLCNQPAQPQATMQLLGPLPPRYRSAPLLAAVVPLGSSRRMLSTTPLSRHHHVANAFTVTRPHNAETVFLVVRDTRPEPDLETSRIAKCSLPKSGTFPTSQLSSLFSMRFAMAGAIPKPD